MTTMTFEEELAQRRVREAVVDALKKNRAFLDAAAGLRLLHEWHGFDMVDVVATEIEVRRAVYAANLESYLTGCDRIHSNREDEETGAFPDGHVLRQVMAAAGIVGDWFFCPMLEHCKNESFKQFQ